MRSLAREADVAAIRARLGRVSPDSVRRWGRMSAHQMICHVADAFRMATGELPVTDLSSLFGRTVVKGIALYAPLPWPTGRLQTVPELDRVASGACSTDFAADVAVLHAQLDRMIASRTWPMHPFFGRLSTAQWLRWGYLHTDHHLRQFGE